MASGKGVRIVQKREWKKSEKQDRGRKKRKKKGRKRGRIGKKKGAFAYVREESLPSPITNPR